jgi:uncharacterized protein (DUF1684 family)
LGVVTSITLTIAAALPGCGSYTTTSKSSGGSTSVSATASALPQPDSKLPASGYEAEITTWREARVKRLTSDTGWLTVAGLFWLHPGENSFGTDATNDIVLPDGSAPARAGVFVHDAGTTTIRAFPGTPLVWHDKPVETLKMRSDAEDSTDVVALNDLRFFVIKRSDRWGIRMRDLHSAMRRDFHGIDAYRIDPAYRVEARFEPYVPPRGIPIASIIGTVDTMTCPGALVFKLGGKELRLDPVLEAPDADELFLIFKDETSGDETYGAGRFLYTELPKDGKVVVDFNKAYNPPCAFTAFATCPLPPPENDLPIGIRAGEKAYAEH